MGVNQQQLTDNTGIRDSAIQLLQSNVEQKSFSNKTTGSDTDKIDAADTRILKRSKRQKSRALSKSLCKMSKSSRAKLGMVDGVPVLTRS